MDEGVAEFVHLRAMLRCEYCRLPDYLHPGSFEIDHIIPLQHGGTDAKGNLAYACIRCNLAKGPNLAGIDRLTSRTILITLFSPRRHKWNRHFAWDRVKLVGKTPIGRVTVAVLQINDPIPLELRECLVAEEGTGQWSVH
jgi:hypothetical protein